MKKIIGVDKKTDLQYLNMYQCSYLVDGQYYHYNFASRRNQNELECLGIHKVDAVRILPYFVKDDKTYVILIKEFRYPINSYIFSVPAGLIDENEEGLDAAKRELKEEIGAEVVKIELVQKASYTGAGLSDEVIECYEAEVKLSYAQDLGSFEDISIKTLLIDDLLTFIEQNNVGMQSALQLKEFYYRHKYESAFKNKEKN